MTENNDITKVPSSSTFSFFTNNPGISAFIIILIILLIAFIVLYATKKSCPSIKGSINKLYNQGQEDFEDDNSINLQE